MSKASAYAVLPLTMLTFWLVRYTLPAADVSNGWLVELLGWLLLVLVVLAAVSHWRWRLAEQRRQEWLQRADDKS